MSEKPIQQVDDYFVFISYSSKDEKLAKWLQHELESYHLPTNLERKPRENLRKVFRDRTELSAGELGPQVEKALNGSTHLVVICSPNSAQSSWVDLEIRTFIKLHDIRFDDTNNNNKNHKILPFIIEGDSPNEYFTKTLKDLQAKGIDLLGGDINKDGGNDAAFIKVVSGLLNLPYPILWNRYAKEKAEEEQQEKERRDNLYRSQSLFLSEKSMTLTNDGDPYKGCLYALEALPKRMTDQERPLVPEAVEALYKSVFFERGLLYEKPDELKHKAPITQITYNNDGRFLISCSNTYISLWNVQTGQLINKWDVHKNDLDNFDDKINNLICYGDGEDELIITGVEDETIKIWRLSNGESVEAIPTPPNTWAKAIASYGNKIAMAFVDNSIGVYNMPSRNGDITFQRTEKLDCWTILSISINDKFIVTGSFDGTIGIFDSKTLKQVREKLRPKLKKQGDYITSICIDNDIIVAGSTDGIIYRWHIYSWEQLPSIEDANHNHGGVNVVINHKNIIIAGYNDGSVLFWGQTGVLMLALVAGDCPVTSLAFNGKYLAAGLKNGILYTCRINRIELIKIQQDQLITTDVFWANNHQEDTKQFLLDIAYEEYNKTNLFNISKNNKAISNVDVKSVRNDRLTKLIGEPKSIISPFLYTPKSIYEAIALYGDYILVKEFNSTKINLYSLNNECCKTFDMASKKTMFSQVENHVIVCNYRMNKDTSSMGYTSLFLFDFANQTIKEIAKLDGFRASHIWLEGDNIIIIGDDGVLDEKMLSWEEENVCTYTKTPPKISSKEKTAFYKYLKEQHKKFFIVNISTKKIITVIEKSPINLDSCVLIDHYFLYAHENSRLLYMYDTIRNKRKRIAKLEEKITSVFDDEQKSQKNNEQESFLFRIKMNNTEINVFPTHEDRLIYDNVYNVYKHENKVFARKFDICAYKNKNIVRSINKSRIVWELGEGYLVRETMCHSLNDLINTETSTFKELKISDDEKRKYYLT